MGIRKPTSQISASAKRNPKRRNKTEPTVMIGAPEKPEGLRVEVSEKWDEVVKTLMDIDCIYRSDADSLKAYCEAYVNYQVALEDTLTNGLYKTQYKMYMGDYVKHEGELVVEKHVVNPATRVMNESMNIMIKLMSQLGLTPVARAGLNIVPKITVPGAVKLTKSDLD